MVIVQEISKQDSYLRHNNHFQVVFIDYNSKSTFEISCNLINLKRKKNVYSRSGKRSHYKPTIEKLMSNQNVTNKILKTFSGILKIENFQLSRLQALIFNEITSPS